jgi:hypothetical protein
MHYNQIPETYRDDLIAEALYSREIEFFHYDFDRANFEFLLSVTPPGPELEDLKHRLSETQQRMASVSRYIAALNAQITDQSAHASAVARAKAKRESQ